MADATTKQIMQKIQHKRIESMHTERMRAAGLNLEPVPNGISTKRAIAILERRLQKSAQWLDAYIQGVGVHMQDNQQRAFKLIVETRRRDKQHYEFLKRIPGKRSFYATGNA